MMMISRGSAAMASLVARQSHTPRAACRGWTLSNRITSGGEVSRHRPGSCVWEGGRAGSAGRGADESALTLGPKPPTREPEEGVRCDESLGMPIALHAVPWMIPHQASCGWGSRVRPRKSSSPRARIRLYGARSRVCDLGGDRELTTPGRAPRSLDALLVLPHS